MIQSVPVKELGKQESLGEPGIKKSGKMLLTVGLMYDDGVGPVQNKKQNTHIIFYKMNILVFIPYSTR